MRENLPNLVKEIDMQVQEAQKVPTKMDINRPTPKYIMIKMPKVKDKERTWKAAREKQLLAYRGIPIRLSADFSKEILQAKGIGRKYSKSWKAGTYSQDCSTQQSFHLEQKGRLSQVQGVHHHQAIIIWIVKGTYLKKRR